MKLILGLSLFVSLSSFAEKGPEFDEFKSKIVANIDERIAAMNAHKACVQGAANREALKACREAHKTKMKSLKEENQGERKAWKEKMKERRGKKD